jgi:hypothetical protein
VVVPRHEFGLGAAALVRRSNRDRVISERRIPLGLEAHPSSLDVRRDEARLASAGSGCVLYSTCRDAPFGGTTRARGFAEGPYRAGRPRGAEHAHQNLLPDGRSAAGRVCGMGTSRHRIQLAVPARANAPLGNDEATDPHDAGDPGPTGHEEASRATVIGGQRLPVHLLGDRRVALERLPRVGSRGPRATRRVLRRARNRQWSSASPGSRGRRAAPLSTRNPDRALRARSSGKPPFIRTSTGKSRAHAHKGQFTLLLECSPAQTAASSSEPTPPL